MGMDICVRSLMAGPVSNRHLIQAIHRPVSETLTLMTGVGVPGYPIRTKRPDLEANHTTPAAAASPCLAAAAAGSQNHRNRVAAAHLDGH
jgi:hypothetical protein